MCFSANASLLAGSILVPAGAFCTETAWQKNRSYVPLSLIPFFFGIQQLGEAGVWTGLESDDAGLVKVSTLVFLFFAIMFWPFWVPLAVAILDHRPVPRRVFFALSAVGLGGGFLFYIEAALHYGEWLTVGIEGHSIRYDLSRVPVAQAVAGVVWQTLYLALVCVPLLISRESRLRVLGISVAVAAIIANVTFRYAFASVWCFFAAMLSVHIYYVLYRLPKRHELPVTVLADTKATAY